jgi:hypothetical protein
MSNIIHKIKTNGLSWFLRRTLQEIIQPTAMKCPSKKLKKLAVPLYWLLCKPMNQFNYLMRALKNDQQNTLYFIYDLDVEPMTYNFCWALAIAEAQRQSQGLAELTIVVIAGRHNGQRKESVEYDGVVNSAAREWRLYSIIHAAAMLLPNQPNFCYYRSRQSALLQLKNKKHRYPQQHTVSVPIPHQMSDAFPFKQQLMALQAPKKGLEYVSAWLNQQAKKRKIITITLRQYDYCQERNSNITAWATFANQLNQDEFFIIFIPDTETGLYEPPEALRSFCNFSAASWHIGIRAALYELAYLNLGVNSGPMSLCWFNRHCRYLCFKMTIEKTNSAASKENMTKLGFTVGQNPAFVNDYQQWEWQEDHEPEITKAFHQMVQKIEQSSPRQNKQTSPIMAT